MDISGLSHDPTFCPEFKEPYETVEWVEYDAVIENPKTGEVVFEQLNVEFPESWSQQSVNIVASKYFFGDLDEENGSPANGKREYALWQLIDRVADTIVDAGQRRGYFAYTSDAEAFRADMKWLLLHQHFAFNSPVWFNVGLGQEYGVKEGDEQNLLFNHPNTEEPVQEVDPYVRPQAAACFIVDIPDDIDGIWDMMKESARLFKFGSGVGADWSSLRSSKERVSGGGTASGPVSFMRVQDATGATIKSGGKTRRSAIMQILRADHPDIWDFVDVKREEEKKAHALIDAGYDSSFNGEAYATADFQDVNQSVRIEDAFFHNMEKDRKYPMYSVTEGEELGNYRPSDLLNKIAENTHDCGDPGLQYDGEIQRWHTCKETGRINGSNPCSEFLFLDNTACNLASINLQKIEKEDGGWDSEALQDIAEIAFVGQDILCDIAGYPSEDIAERSEEFRPLGLGFCNLGATLMAHGIPYDSDEGRAIASALQANIHFAAYNASTKMAKEVGPYPGYDKNQESHDKVMDLHHKAAQRIFNGHHEYLSEIVGEGSVLNGDAAGLMRKALHAAEEMQARGEEYGYRNSQATVIAPTGTISFYMGATTTGIEPSPALVQYKNLAGEDDSQIKIVNDVVGDALRSFGYDHDAITLVENYIQENDTIEGVSPILRENGFEGLTEEELAVFDCAITPFNGERSIDPYGHTDMMAGVQPFVSGAISKTVNLPEDATVEDIEEAYVRGWKKGLKALAIYRDGSKRSQAVSTTDGSEDSDETEEVTAEDVDSADDFFHSDPEKKEFEVDQEVVKGKNQVAAINFLAKDLAKELEQGEISLKKILDYLGDTFTLREMLKAAVEYSDYREIASLLDLMAGEEISQEHPSLNLAATADEFNEFNMALDTVASYIEDDKVSMVQIAKSLGMISEMYPKQGADANRRKLPDEAPSVRKKFRVGNVEGYIHVGLYPDTRKPGEIFITVSKEGSTLAGVMDSFATALSLALQYGVPLEDLVQKFKNQRFEPSGFTGDDIQSATSIVDYVAQWLEQYFLVASDEEEEKEYNFEWTERTKHPFGKEVNGVDESEDFDPLETTKQTTFDREDNEHPLDPEGRGESFSDVMEDTTAKICENCGSVMQQNGTCYVCPTCGEDTGCGA